MSKNQNNIHIGRILLINWILIFCCQKAWSYSFCQEVFSRHHIDTLYLYPEQLLIVPNEKPSANELQFINYLELDHNKLYSPLPTHQAEDSTKNYFANISNSIVVETKNPNQKLSTEQIDALKDFMNVSINPLIAEFIHFQKINNWDQNNTTPFVDSLLNTLSHLLSELVVLRSAEPTPENLEQLFIKKLQIQYNSLFYSRVLRILTYHPGSEYYHIASGLKSYVARSSYYYLFKSRYTNIDLHTWEKQMIELEQNDRADRRNRVYSKQLAREINRQIHQLMPNSYEWSDLYQQSQKGNGYSLKFEIHTALLALYFEVLQEVYPHFSLSFSAPFNRTSRSMLGEGDLSSLQKLVEQRTNLIHSSVESDLSTGLGRHRQIRRIFELLKLVEQYANHPQIHRPSFVFWLTNLLSVNGNLSLDTLENTLREFDIARDILKNLPVTKKLGFSIEGYIFKGHTQKKSMDLFVFDKEKIEKQTNEMAFNPFIHSDEIIEVKTLSRWLPTGSALSIPTRLTIKKAQSIRERYPESQLPKMSLAIILQIRSGESVYENSQLMNQKKVFDSQTGFFTTFSQEGYEWVEKHSFNLYKTTYRSLRKMEDIELLDRITIYTSDMVPLKSFIFPKANKEY